MTPNTGVGRHKKRSWGCAPYTRDRATGESDCLGRKMGSYSKSSGENGVVLEWH